MKSLTEESTILQSAGSFSSYVDYARFNMMQSVEDNTVYNGDGSPSNYDLNTDQPPDEAYYFTKEGVQINNKSPLGDRSYDPQNAKFLLVELCKIWKPTDNDFVKGLLNIFAPGVPIGKWINTAIPVDLNKTTKEQQNPAYDINKKNETEFSFQQYADDGTIKQEIISIANTDFKDFNFNTGRFLIKFYEEKVEPLESQFNESNSSDIEFYVADKNEVYNPFSDNTKNTYDYVLSCASSNKNEDNFYYLEYPICAKVKKIDDTGESYWEYYYEKTIFGKLIYEAEAISNDGGSGFRDIYWDVEKPFSQILNNVVKTITPYLDNPKAVINGEVPDIHFEDIDFKTYKDEPMFIGNMHNKKRKFSEKEAENIFIYDGYGYDAGKALQVHVKRKTNNKIRLFSETEVYLTLKYPVVVADSANYRPIAGWIHLGTKLDVNNLTYQYEWRVKKEYIGSIDTLDTDRYEKRNGSYYLKPKYLTGNGYPAQEFMFDKITINGKTAGNKYGYKIVSQRHLLATGYTAEIESLYAEGYKDGDFSNKTLKRHWYDGYLTKDTITFPSYIFVYDESEEYDNLEATYEKESKEWYTDQKDLNERDNTIDKKNMVKEIVGKLVVSQVLSLVQKGLHYLAVEYKANSAYEEIITWAAGAAHEVAKRVENSMAQNIAYKAAKETYKAFSLWKTTMDLAKDIRKTYKGMEKAFKGLKNATDKIADNYREFTWNELKNRDMKNLINEITDNKEKFNGYIDYLKQSKEDFNLAVDNMALQVDLAKGGVSGPLNPYIDAISLSIMDNMYSTAQASEQLKEFVSEKGIMNNVVKNVSAENNVSDGFYTSNITSLAKDGISSIKQNLLNDEISAMSAALLTMGSKSKSWVNHYEKMSNMPSELMDEDNENKPDEFDEFFELKGGKLNAKKDKNPFLGAVRLMDYNGSTFSDYSDDNLKKLEKIAKE